MPEPLSPGPLLRLQESLAAIGPAAVAVSGGVDSMTLAVVAGRVATDQFTMVHAVSPAVPPSATGRVREHAAREGWRLMVLDAGEFDDARYRANPANRCYFCKHNLYTAMGESTESTLLSGTNLDDLGDFRPGLEAAREQGVRHPYVEARIDKSGVRAIARSLGLDDLAELPSAPCLSSRIETGVPIEAHLLEFVDRAEESIRRALGASVVRARVRAERIDIELDAVALADLSPGRAKELTDRVTAMAGAADIRLPVHLGAYRMGSAFLRAAGA